VAGIHDLHIWPMSTTEIALTCHLIMPSGHPGDVFIYQMAESTGVYLMHNVKTMPVRSGAKRIRNTATLNKLISEYAPSWAGGTAPHCGTSTVPSSSSPLRITSRQRSKRLSKSCCTSLKFDQPADMTDGGTLIVSSASVRATRSQPRTANGFGSVDRTRKQLAGRSPPAY
jgi:hypothetical protein